MPSKTALVFGRDLHEVNCSYSRFKHSPAENEENKNSYFSFILASQCLVRQFK